MKDFFISYNKADRSWAEWIAWQLEEMECSVVVQAWDFGPGCNFILEMDKAAKETERTIAVLSPDYLKSIYTKPEWAAILARDPTGANRKLLPIRVRDCEPDGLLAAISRIDLIGLDEAAAKVALQACLTTGRAKPQTPPPFPKPVKQLHFPGDLPECSDLPTGSRLPFLPNAVFTGRREDLLELAKSLLHSKLTKVGLTQSAAVITGCGGVGKTQLAVEFCYRYGFQFQGVHWIHADRDIPSEIAACGAIMDIPSWSDKVPDQVELTLRSWSKDGPRLVVMDNVFDQSLMQEWMPRMPHCRLLLTSRQSEWPPDMGLETLPLGILTLDQSRELLRKLSIRLIDVLDNEVDGIASRLGCLPLALDLAGRYLNDRPDLPPNDYLRALEAQGNALKHSSLTEWVNHNPTRHVTNLATTFALSWNRLDDKEVDILLKRIFRACGYCAPNTPIPRELIQKAVCTNDSKELLDMALNRLFSLGLAIPADNGPILHPLLAEFARLIDEKYPESVLRHLVNALVELVSNDYKSGLPDTTKTIQEHVYPVYKFAQTANLEEADKLVGFIPLIFDFSIPGNPAILFL